VAVATFARLEVVFRGNTKGSVEKRFEEREISEKSTYIIFVRFMKTYAIFDFCNMLCSYLLYDPRNELSNSNRNSQFPRFVTFLE